MSPRERLLLRFSVDQFFECQLDDGTWPRSRPLFLYPNLGYAYCFDYELLVPLLADRQLGAVVFGRLEALIRAATTLDDRRFPLKPKSGAARTAYGWASGHHGSKRQAESWATASVFHFCLELDRLVGEAIRRDVFEYVGARYEQPSRAASKTPALAKTFVDSTVKRGDARRSLKEILTEHFILPLVAARNGVEEGGRFPDDISVSAILYGPPGTSKTELAKQIAGVLGWPLLPLDPSHLTRNGLEAVHKEADTLFGRLQFCDQVVVLLDEFDELVREREGTGELQSRFLTTAMLPKLAGLSERRRLVYLVATNHLEQFDAAIRRPGRFDVILPVMPPNLDAKLDRWPELVGALGLLTGENDTLDRPTADNIVADLTFLETKELAKRIKGATTPAEVSVAISRAGDAATMRQSLSEREPESTSDWGARMAMQEPKIRIKGYEL